MLILVHTRTNRLSYLFKWMFSGQPCIDHQYTTDRSAFLAFEGPKFQYGGKPVGQDIPYWPSQGLLEETGIRQQALDQGPGAVLFPASGALAHEHDPFAACFYLLSRYEEYLPFQPDRFGRFEGSQSVLAKKGLAEYPLADMLRQEVIDRLSERYPELVYKPAPFRPVITIDIDQAFEFGGKSIIRTFGSVIKSGFTNWNRLSTQLQVLIGAKPDPYVTYDFILDELQRSRLPFLFFVLCRSGTAHDHQVSLNHPAFKKLITKLASFTEPGIHPSFYSNGDSDRLQTEIRFLQNLAGKKIFRSRQHYLRLFFPGTYRQLLAEGIQEDYSMGYSSTPGFRAGTCSPFFWYDLEKEASTPLKVFPVTFMEGTYADYLDLPAEAAWERMEALMKTVERYSGHFIPIWHNHTVSRTKTWDPWRTIFTKMIHWLEERQAK